MTLSLKMGGNVQLPLHGHVVRFRLILFRVILGTILIIGCLDVSQFLDSPKNTNVAAVKLK